MPTLGENRKGMLLSQKYNFFLPPNNVGVNAPEERNKSKRRNLKREKWKEKR